MMPWIYLLLALAALAVAFVTHSTTVLALALLAALALIVAFALGLLAQRIGSRSRDESVMLDPTELRRLREQAEARRAAAGNTPPQPPAP
jgi:membrane protein implicated in regulation of membrane protease activity